MITEGKLNFMRKVGLQLCIPMVLVAQTPDVKKDPCDNPISTMDMRECALKKYQAADAQLNVAFKLLTEKIKASPYNSAQYLINSERAWIKYRDENANFEASFYEGGSIKDQIRLYALIRMTQARTKEINDLVASEFDR